VKAQFKYAFHAGGRTRFMVFLPIVIMQIIFITLGVLNLLPFPAQVVSVSLSGVSIAVMAVFNILGDIAITRRLFSPPGAYLYALTPTPRYKALLASVISMTVMDLFTMGIVIFGQVWLALNLAGGFMDMSIWSMISEQLHWLPTLLLLLVQAISAYLIVMMTILFCITARKSFLFHKSAGGFLAVLLAFGVMYIISLTPIILAPFSYGGLERFWFTLTIRLTNIGTILYPLLLFFNAAVLFFLTAKLMERKMNI